MVKLCKIQTGSTGFDQKIQNLSLTYLEDGNDGSLLGRPHVDEDVAAAAHGLGDQLHHLVHREDVANVDVPAMTPRH